MRLKELRVSENLSQNEIAKQIGLKQFTYSNYETGVTEPKIQTLIDLADYYNVSLDYLVGRDFANQYAYLTENEKNLLDVFREMTEDNQQVYYQEGKGILLAQNVKF